MNKMFKKFYEREINRYYTLNIESNDGVDELFIATETFLKLNRKFLKDKKVTQGLKLLKVGVPMLILFEKVMNLQPKEVQKYDAEEFLQYNIDFTPKQLTKTIEDYYKKAIKEHLQEMEENQKIKIDEIESRIYAKYEGTDTLPTQKELRDATSAIKKNYKKMVEKIKGTSPISQSIFLYEPEGNDVIRALEKNGSHHLYSEKVTPISRNVYLYNINEFGKLTITVMFTVKKSIQSIDTFMYDVEILKELMYHVYEENYKEEGED